MHFADIKRVRELLENGVDINANYVKCTYNPLSHAVLMGNDEMVSFLIERGADVDYQDANGCTLVHYKSTKNADKVMKVLMDVGIRVDIKNNKGHTPYECNDVLINKHFYKPLEQTVKSGEIEKVARYMRQGSSAHFRDRLTNF